MVKVINRFTKTTMWVAEERLEEYLGAGHVLASDNVCPVVVEEPKEEPVEEIKPIEEPVAPKKKGRPKKK